MWREAKRSRKLSVCSCAVVSNVLVKNVEFVLQLDMMSHDKIVLLYIQF